MKLIVTGGRGYNNREAVFAALDELYRDNIYLNEVIHGACPTGTDAHAAAWLAKHPDVYETALPAEWTVHGRAAGPMRNAAMVKHAGTSGEAVVCLVFPGGKGTADCARRARVEGFVIIEGGASCM